MYQGLKENKPARVIYLDMNAFFASIEQELDPSCRNKPVAVVSHLHPRGTVLASSYEAKALGISTGTKVSEALEKCPGIIFKETQLAVYRGFHKKFVGLLDARYGPEILVRSVDEVAIILPLNWQGSFRAREIALEIKALFKSELGSYIKCSIGIAPNIFLAKLATNLEKPDGLVEINDQNIEPILGSLKLTDLPGIAYKSSVRLAWRGITTPLSLYQQDVNNLRKWFGIWGQQWWWRLHGFETDDKSLIVDPLKSMSHQHVLTRWSSDQDEILKYVDVMTNRLIFRLQNNKLKCYSIGIYFSRAQATGLGLEHKFSNPCSNNLEILNEIIRMCRQTIGRENIKDFPIRRIVIYFGGLSAEGGFQMDLFEDNKKKELLSQTIQMIREKYGFESISPACAIMKDEFVPKEQIGFGKVKDKG